MPDDAATDFGAYLRQARERRGVSLRDIAASTKISLMALEALERNDISRLPGGIFTRAFVRAYAREVGLDPERTVEQFVARFPEETVTAGTTYESAAVVERNEGRWPGAQRALRVVGVIAPVILVVLYFVFGSRYLAPRQTPAPPAPRSAPVAAGPAATPLTAASTPGSGPAAAMAPIEAAPRGPGAGKPAAAEGASPLPPASAVRPATQAGQAAAPPAGTVLRLIVAPSGPCWVSARLDGTQRFSRLMQPGEREELDARDEIVLTVGDAGAFAFSLNNVPGRALGTPGQVVTVRITAGNYQTYLAVR